MESSSAVVRSITVSASCALTLKASSADARISLASGTDVTTNLNAEFKGDPAVEKISNHPDAAHLKRPDAIIRHACRDCAFSGRCQNAPSCITRYIKEICNNNDQRLIKNAIYFKYNKKNDKLIDSIITPQIHEDLRHVKKDEWLKSLSSDQHIKYQEIIKLFKD